MNSFVKKIVTVAATAALTLSSAAALAAAPLQLGVPDDGTNLSRGIKLLEAAGFIEVDPAAGYTPEIKDITKYLYNVEVTPIAANTLPSTLGDFAASTINGTYAVPYGLIPSRDGRIYELRKMEQGEFIAPKNNVVDFSEIRAGFIPALPKIPAQLMGEIIAFFRSFMTESEENEAMAQIYWDKAEKRFFAYVPKQSVCKEEVEANLHDCPYDDEERYICYADIHSHNSMDAFFSGKDDRDECSTGLYLVLGRLDHFYPEIKARIFCGDSFVPIDPAEVIEGLEQPFPQEWLEQVSVRSALPKKEKKRSLREFLSEVW